MEFAHNYHWLLKNKTVFTTKEYFSWKYNITEHRNTDNGDMTMAWFKHLYMIRQPFFPLKLSQICPNIYSKCFNTKAKWRFLCFKKLREKAGTAVVINDDKLSLKFNTL